MPAPNLWIRIVAALTPNCDVVTRLVSESRERTLTAPERIRLRWHYRICQWCRRYRDQIDEVGTAAKHEGAGRALGPNRKAELRKLLE